LVSPVSPQVPKSISGVSFKNIGVTCFFQKSLRYKSIIKYKITPSLFLINKIAKENDLKSVFVQGVPG